MAKQASPIRANHGLKIMPEQRNGSFSALHQDGDEDEFLANMAVDEEFEQENESDEDSEYHFLIGEGGRPPKRATSATGKLKDLAQELAKNAKLNLANSIRDDDNHHHNYKSNIEYTAANQNYYCDTNYMPTNTKQHESGLLNRLFGLFQQPSQTNAFARSSLGEPRNAKTTVRDHGLFYPDRPSASLKPSLGEVEKNHSLNWMSKNFRRASRLLKRSQRQTNETPKSPPERGSDARSCGCTRVICLSVICLGAIIASIVLLILLLTRKEDPAFKVILDEERIIDEKWLIKMKGDLSSKWMVESSKCHLPRVDPWDASIKSYLKRKDPLDCKRIVRESLKDQLPSNGIGLEQRIKATRTLTYLNRDKIYFTDEAIQEGALKTGACCYSAVRRTPNSDNDFEIDFECHAISKSPFAPDSSVMQGSKQIEIQCQGLKYKNYHMIFLHDQEEEEALRRVAALKLDQDDYYNVVMVGVDTVSQPNARRQFNETLQYLLDQYETINFVGYNKVGENTFPNLVPLLTGLTPRQLIETSCWASTTFAGKDKGDQPLDNCKYLWNFYQQLGYVSYFSEDWPQSSTFNYLKQGFEHEPTTYYGRPFVLARESLTYPKSGCRICQLDRPIAEIDLRNLRTFIETHSDGPYFAFHWVNCPHHDDLNGGSTVDSIFKQFFSQIKDLTVDQRTFVIFFSDHGYRWSDFADTPIGHLESSIPLLTIAAPKKFIEKHPRLYKRLKQHQSSLLTPFDFFKTLIHIRNLSANKTQPSPAPSHTKAPQDRRAPSDSENKQAFTNGTTSTTIEPSTAVTTFKQIKIDDGTTYKQSFKTVSFFGKHAPEDLDRSCIEAGIPDSFCVCQKFTPMRADSTEALGAAYYLVYVHLYNQIKEYQHICHLLDLDKIFVAEMYSFEDSLATRNQTASFHMNHRTKRSQVEESQVMTTTTMPSNLKHHQTTTARPSEKLQETHEEKILETRLEAKLAYLPNREYNIIFTTKPGEAKFQEIVRFYGDDLNKCIMAAQSARRVIEDKWATVKDKHETVINMNEVCEFNVLSESISRLNLYGSQSKCLTGHAELKKMCLCK